MFSYVLVTLLGYFLGSIPFGLLLTKAAGLGDIRAIGSGNIGATNVLRTGRKGLAAATLVLDALKGALAVVLAQLFFPAEPLAAMVAGVAAFLGHCFPIWLKFKGGKGVATFIGILLALCWPVALSFGVIWLLAAKLYRYSSLAALLAALATPLFGFTASGVGLALATALMTALIFWRHSANIARLYQGIEPKIGQKSTS
jgi:glycerol-3-phosphate acyltransferase PlsY